jgi:hypothetical protein
LFTVLRSVTVGRAVAEKEQGVPMAMTKRRAKRRRWCGRWRHQ